MYIVCVYILLVYTVMDENDNSPIFGQPTYTFTIPENTEQLVAVGVAATDIDVGINREITYSIIAGNEDYTFILGERTHNGSDCWRVHACICELNCL